MFNRIISLLLCFTILGTTDYPYWGNFAYAQDFNINQLPLPGSMVDLSSAYDPILIKGLKIHPENPFLFDFIIDTGESDWQANNPLLHQESEKLIKYFLATVTIPDNDLWVNLSPYEKNRIIPEELGNTELGTDLLAEDYILKQLTASLIYPEKNLGKDFWDRVYAKARALYGTSQVPANTFNKVWILADKAKVFVHDNTAIIVGAHLKVMLQEDYLALSKHQGTLPDEGALNAKASQGNNQPINSIASQIIRAIILPEIEKEVNSGKNFSNLRQIFYSMILATWYKKNLKEALLNQVYADKAKIKGVDLGDKTIKDKIYLQYLQAYKKGVFNFIKEDVDPGNGQRITRKYFSGGLVHLDMAQVVDANDPDTRNFFQKPQNSPLFIIKADMKELDKAMNATQEALTTRFGLKYLYFLDWAGTVVNVDYNPTMGGINFLPMEEKVKEQLEEKLDAGAMIIIATGDRSKKVEEGLIQDKKGHVIIPKKNRYQIAILEQSTMVGKMYDDQKNAWRFIYDAKNTMSSLQQENWPQLKDLLIDFARQVAQDKNYGDFGNRQGGPQTDPVDKTIEEKYDRGNMEIRSHQLTLEIRSDKEGIKEKAQDIKDRRLKMIEEMSRLIKSKETELKAMGFPVMLPVPAGEAHIDWLFIPDWDKEKGLQELWKTGEVEKILQKTGVREKLPGVDKDKIAGENCIAIMDSPAGNDRALGRFVHKIGGTVVSVNPADRNNRAIDPWVKFINTFSGPMGLVSTMMPASFIDDRVFKYKGKLLKSRERERVYLDKETANGFANEFIELMLSTPQPGSNDLKAAIDHFDFETIRQALREYLMNYYNNIGLESLVSNKKLVMNVIGPLKEKEAVLKAEDFIDLLISNPQPGTGLLKRALEANERGKVEEALRQYFMNEKPGMTNQQIVNQVVNKVRHIEPIRPDAKDSLAPFFPLVKGKGVTVTSTMGNLAVPIILKLRKLKTDIASFYRRRASSPDEMEIWDALAQGEIVFFNGDLRDNKDVEILVSNMTKKLMNKRATQNPLEVQMNTAVVHLGDIPVSSMYNPAEVFTNIISIINILKSMKEMGADRLVFTSTVNVYDVGKNPYSMAKYFQEKIIEKFCLLNNIRYVILRLPAVGGSFKMGDHERGDSHRERLLPSIVNAIKEGRTYPITVGGKTEVGFIDYREVSDIIARALTYLFSGAKDNPSIDIVPKDSRTFNRLVKTIQEEIAPKEFKVDWKVDRETFSGKRIKLSRLFAFIKLGWVAKRTFREIFGQVWKLKVNRSRQPEVRPKIVGEIASVESEYMKDTQRAIMDEGIPLDSNDHLEYFLASLAFSLQAQVLWNDQISKGNMEGLVDNRFDGMKKEIFNLFEQRLKNFNLNEKNDFIGNNQMLDEEMLDKLVKYRAQIQGETGSLYQEQRNYIDQILRILKKDFAMSSNRSNTPGGIDLNGKNLQFEINQDTPMIMKLDPVLMTDFVKGDFSGVIPVIYSISPLPKNYFTKHLLSV